MALSAGASAKLAVNRTRPSASAITGAASPHTPLNRSVSASLYNSPSASFRVDEENLLIFEIGARVLRAGFAGESKPRCEINYGPDQLRRIGDYRQHAPDYTPQSDKGKRRHESWARDGYQLWSPDLQNQDLSFIGERIERLIREVEACYLMLDTRSRKVGLVVSPQLPRPFLELALSALFGVLQASTITILASDVMTVVAAGLRSGLVVDIGWSETSVSAVYEYREVLQSRTVRASRILSRDYANILGEDNELTLEEAEDLCGRLGWCRDREPSDEAMKFAEDVIEVDVLGGTFKVSRAALSLPTERTLFATHTKLNELDDHDLPIHLLAFNALLRLPVDVRKSCMSRIIVTGGASHIPGLKTRLLQELRHLVSNRGWNPIKNYGSAIRLPRRRADIMTERPVNVPPRPNVKYSENTSAPPQDLPSLIPANLASQERDEVIAKIEARNGSKNKPVEGVLRGVQSLGPWAGASLTTSLRVRGVAEIEREKFMSVGLTGILAKTPTSAAGRVPSGSMSTWL